MRKPSVAAFAVSCRANSEFCLWYQDCRPDGALLSIQIPHRSPLADERQADRQEEHAGQKHDHKIPGDRKSQNAGKLREQYDSDEKPNDRPKRKSDARPQQAVRTRNTPIRLPIKIWSPDRRIEDKGQPSHRTPDKKPGRRPEILWIKGIQNQQKSRGDADQNG